MAWVDDIENVLESLGGIASLTDIYAEISLLKGKDFPQSSVRETIQQHSSDSQRYRGKDLFYSVNGIGNGIWGLRSKLKLTPHPHDNSENDEETARVLQTAYRILRDTELARKIKELHGHKCQLCDFSIVLPNGNLYAEAHHIKPLGNPHKGPDIITNLLVVCPNHHAELDYGVISLELHRIRTVNGHNIGEDYINYHNNNIYNKIPERHSIK